MKYSKELHEVDRLTAEYNNLFHEYTRICSENNRLEIELAELQSERRWIPVSKPPEHNNSVLLADFDSAEKYECGIPATVGFYFRGEWRLPTGSGVSPTHYKDCIIDNDERIGLDNLPEEDE